VTTIERTCEALGRVLHEGNDVHRCCAARALGGIGHGAGSAALIEALGDADEDVRADAAEALGRLAEVAAVPALIRSLVEDPDGAVKVAAVAALGGLRAAEATPLLRRLVRERDPAICWDEQGWVEDGWDDWLDVQLAAVAALGRIGAAEAVPDIRAAIDDEMGQDLGEAAMKALAALGAPGVAAVAAFLDRPDARSRRRAVAALATAAGEAAVAALASALTDSAPEVRLAAIRALALANPGDHRLAALLDDPEPAVRAEALRRIGGAEPDRLVTAIGDPAPGVRVAALKAVTPGAADWDTLTRTVTAALDDPSPAVAAAAADALARAAAASAGEALARRLTDEDAPVEVRAAAARALARLADDASVEALTAVIGDQSRAVRLAAMAGLARSAAAGSGPARETLLGALAGAEQRPDEPAGPAEAPAVEEAPAPVATRVSGRDAEAPRWPTSTLEAMLGGGADQLVEESPKEEPVDLSEDDLAYLELARSAPRKRRVSPEPRIAAAEDTPRLAARLLGEVAGADVARALAAALSAPDGEVRQAAAESLARLVEGGEGLDDDEVVGALIAVAAAGDRMVRLGAVRALGHAPAPSVARALAERLADTDTSVRTEAVRAMARLGRVGPDAVRLLDDAEAPVRLAAATAIAAAQGVAAVPRLVAFVFAFDGCHRREAARLVRDLDAEAATTAFLEVLADRGRMGAWRIAIEALEALHPSEPTGTAALEARIVA